MENVGKQVIDENKNIGKSQPLPEIVSEQERDYEGYFKARLENNDEVRKCNNPMLRAPIHEYC